MFPFTEAVAVIATALPWFWPLCAALLGGVVGSFLECMRFRIPRKIPLRNPPSQCFECHAVLRTPDLVPVLSYLVLRGRCRHCGTRFPSTSTWVELACALLFAGAAYALQSCLLAA
ncbi:MAG: hypothetical protein DI585_02245 [Pseudomonas fluorescens]|nr:MAG: hypothetical protein DI585_02245 [Pseudomonas fluorescens]